jgi:DnaA family protein
MKYFNGAANVVPTALGLQLPDLLSRLMNGVILQIQTLTDAEKLAALQLRANMRGFELPLEVGQFLLQRWPRNLSVLFAALEKLDHLSLVEQRRLTIPFVKQALGMTAT